MILFLWKSNSFKDLNLFLAEQTKFAKSILDKLLLLKDKNSKFDFYELELIL